MKFKTLVKANIWILIAIVIIWFQVLIMGKLSLLVNFIQVMQYPTKEAFLKKFGTPSYIYKGDSDASINLMTGWGGGIDDKVFLRDKEMYLFPLKGIPYKYLVVLFDINTGKNCCVTWVDM